MNSFLPKDYSVPKEEGNYFKFRIGDNRFRILSSPVLGYEYWTKAKKPVRAHTPWDEAPEDAKKNENGGFQKHFWAMIVWNYEAKKVQILEITQKTIMGSIGAYSDNHKWGSPLGYDLVVKAVGEDLEREYTVIAEPHSEAPKADISGINLNALFTGEDPFNSKAVSEEINPEDIPF